MTNFPNPIIIDNGSGVCKIGFSGKSEPSCFPTLIGIPKHSISMIIDSKEIYIGNEALNKKGILNI